MRSARSVRDRQQHATVGVVAMVVTGALAVGLPFLPAPARADSPSASRLSSTKAIVPMESHVSKLRIGADGKPLTGRLRSAAQAVTNDPQLASSQSMGAPADKTVVSSQNQVFEQYNEGNAGGNSSTVTTYGLNSSMTAMSGTPTYNDLLAGRAIIDHQYSSVAGRFTSSRYENVMEFKELKAGSDALLSLGTTDAATQPYPASGDFSGAVASGGTFVLSDGAGTAITNQGSAVSSSLPYFANLTGTSPASATPAYNQQWAVVGDPLNASFIQLVSRADGSCLTHSTDDLNAQIQTAVCDATNPAGVWATHSTSDAAGHTVWFYMTNNHYLCGSGLTLSLCDTSFPWGAHQVTEPGGSVPTWSMNVQNGFPNVERAAPYTMAAGDLDGAATTDPASSTPVYHDEAAVAYTDGNGDWALRVIDYNANSSRLLATAPNPSIQFGQTGTTLSGVRTPGDLIVDVGDFDGDGRNEIATAYQNANADFKWTLWRYNATADGGRQLVMLSACLGCGGTPFDSTQNITLQQGYASSTVGDFDGSGRDQIALAFATATTATADSPADSGQAVHLGIWTLNADLTTRSTSVSDPPMPHGDLPIPDADNPGLALSGIRLVAGNFFSDPANGFGPGRSELALAWEGVYYDKTYNVNTTKDVRGFHITPQYNIYTISSDCGTATSCTTSASPSNGNPSPQPLFPSNPTQVAYRNYGTEYQIPPFSLAAGAFGGDTSTDPPVDGLIANAWLESDEPPPFTGASYYIQQSLVVPWTSGDTTSTKWTINDSQKPGDANWDLYRDTAYDALGNDVVLGAPQVINLQQNIKENVVAAAPPAHVDWLNGAFSNIDATSDFNLQTKSTQGKSFTSSTSNENSWSNGVKQSLDINNTFTEPIGPIQAKSYVDVNQKFEKTWSGLSQSSSNTSNSWTTSDTANASQDDRFSYSADDTLLYRYPVLGTPGEVTDDSTNCPTGCRTYYDVYVPQDSIHFDNAPGKGVTFFQPGWQNLNALSYPAINAAANNPVSTPDLAPYSYIDQNGSVQSVTEPLYNHANTISSDSSSINLDFSQAAGSGTNTTHARTWTVGVDVAASGKVEVDTPLGDDSIAVTASAGFDVSKATTDTGTGTSQTSSDQQFTLNMPGTINSEQEYAVGTAFYYAMDGSARVVHGVDLTDDPLGRSWWSKNYGTTPDPALNLPNRIQLAYNDGDKTYDIPQWITSPQRQLIRGFQALQGGHDGTGLPTAGDPYTITPNSGQSVVFQVPVHNYSLTSMAAGAMLSWYYAPVDAEDVQITATPIKIGTTTVPAITAQNSALVDAPVWTAPTSSTGKMQQYRIFVRLDEDGTSADMHPMTGDACPTQSLVPAVNNTTTALYDTMSTSPTAIDPLGCGQNNQGYGLVTVSPAADPLTGAAGRHATSLEPGGAQLTGGGIVGLRSVTRLTSQTSAPTIPVNQPTTLAVNASATLQVDDQPLVAIYDGPIEDGRILAVTRMPGIDDEAGGAVTFAWTPTKPGLHKLHQVLLSTSASGEDDEQVMQINVAGPPEPAAFKIKASASPTVLWPGQHFTVAGTVTPVATKVADRRVVLQRKVAATETVASHWTTIQIMTTTATGRFKFPTTALRRPGSYAYRVWKSPADGRKGVYSARMSVKVTRAAAKLTLTASRRTVHPHAKVRLSGTATPWPVSIGHHVVLQKRRDGSWRDLRHLEVGSHGRFHTKVVARHRGTLRYRVRLSGTSSKSEAVVIKVRR